jgi:hypothetical protein
MFTYTLFLSVGGKKSIDPNFTKAKTDKIKSKKKNTITVFGYLITLKKNLFHRLDKSISWKSHFFFVFFFLFLKFNNDKIIGKKTKATITEKIKVPSTVVGKYFINSPILQDSIKFKGKNIAMVVKFQAINGFQ